jgi:hypothetical protein
MPQVRAQMSIKKLAKTSKTSVFNDTPVTPSAPAGRALIRLGLRVLQVALLKIYSDHLVDMFEKDLLIKDLGALLLNPDNEQLLKTAREQPDAATRLSSKDKNWLAVLQDIAQLIDVVRARCRELVQAA